MNIFKSKKLEKVCILSVSIFSLIAVFSATSAWFASIRKVDTNGGGFISTAEPSVIDSLEIHPEGKDDNGNTTSYSYQDTATSTYTASSKTWSGVTDDKFQLGTYSSLSPNHSTLLLIKLKDNASNASLKLTTTKAFTDSLVGIDTNNKPTTEIASKGNPLSSILRFSYFEYEDKPTSFDYTSTTLTKKGFYELPTTGFVTEDKYTKSISFSDSIASTTQYIVIIMEYYDEGIQYIYSMNLGSTVLEDESDIKYTCDWKIEL